MVEVEEVAEGIYCIDLLPMGERRVISSYILDFEKKAVVDPGPRSTLNNLAKAMKEIGIERIDCIFVTHVHLDHSGAAASLSNAYNAEIICHENGVRHIANPEKLWRASLKSSPISENYQKPDKGRIDLIKSVKDETKISLGEEKILCIETLGHSSHHLSFFLQEHDVLFTGDSAGLCIDGKIIPTTPPPFDFMLWKESIEVMKNLNSKFLAFTHFGVYERDELLDKVLKKCEEWVELAEKNESLEKYIGVVMENDLDLQEFLKSYSDSQIIEDWVRLGFAGIFENTRNKYRKMI